jgi:hypothetical protein
MPVAVGQATAEEPAGHRAELGADEEQARVADATPDRPQGQECREAGVYGVSLVVLLSVAAEAGPPEGRSAVINTYGLGSDVAQLLGPWGLGLAAGTWGLRGALVVAGAVPLVGAAVFLVARPAPRPAGPTARS